MADTVLTSGAAPWQIGRNHGGDLVHRRAARWVRWCALASLLTAPGVAAGDTSVYHSPADDGASPAGPPTVPSQVPEPLYLWIDSGATASAPGTVCDTGTGDERCGWRLSVEAHGGTFTDFQPEPGVVYDLSGDTLRVNLLDVTAPAAGPARIGRLDVVSTSLTGGVVTVEGAVVGASLEREPVESAAMVFIPEPGVPLSLAAGCALLCCLRSARSHRGRPGCPG